MLYKILSCGKVFIFFEMIVMLTINRLLNKSVLILFRKRAGSY